MSSAQSIDVRRGTPPAREPRATWLLDQLPGCMAADPLLERFVTIFQVIADDLCDRIDGVEHAIDPGVAPPAFRHWLAGWLGIPGLDRTSSPTLQRDLVSATARTLRQRGTAASLAALLEAVTGGPVTVTDGGGVRRAVGPGGGDEDVPPVGRLVRVVVPSTGPMDERELVALLRRELPAHVGLELHVAGRRVFPALRPARSGPGR